MDEIRNLIQQTPFSAAKLLEVIGGMNSVDVADTFELLNREETVQVFRLLPKTMAADVFSEIVPEKQQIIVEALTDAEVGKIMEELFVDEAVDFIEEMPANVVKRVLQNVNEDKRKQINQILCYPEDSAGSIMTTEYVNLREYVTVSEAFDVIRVTGVDKETIYTCYVIQRDRLLVGMITAKTLLISKPEDKIGDIMDKNLVFAYTTDDQEMVADMFRKYDLLSMPVVDGEKRLVGIVTVDDILEVIEEENTEDIEKMAALNPSEEPYIKTNALRLSRNRLPWLLLLMLSATVTGAIIEGFENALSALPMLVAFIPMLMDTAGNAGAQSSALVIRGMALGEIRIKDVLRVLWREIQVSVICGCVMGAVNFLRIYIMNEQNLLMALTVTLSLILTVIIAKSLGCLLPIAAKKIRIDPAVMAAPIITTIADAFSLILYFSMARMIMRI